eukprot:jgi/Mesvir1/7058/Mv09174-RA.1
MKYVVVTGGVVSGLGKGVTASSIGVLLQACGLRVTSIKIDPYINVDAGTMSPFEHGEVFVLDDGGEVDLDLGNYERFLDLTLTRDNNITTGKVYQHVIEKERRGDYLGKTVQVIPHVTDGIQEWIERVALVPVDGNPGGLPPDVCVIELGGTIGDIESMPFVEALRQLQMRVGHHNLCFVHVSLVPVLGVVGEQKTKPTQHSVRELRALGIIPDLLCCRSTEKLEHAVKEKLAVFCHVKPQNILNIHDVSNIWHVPLILEEQGGHLALLKKLHLDDLHPPALTEWRHRAFRWDALTEVVRIAMVGKYTNLSDSYLSVLKALQHACIAVNRKLAVEWVVSTDLEPARKAENPKAYESAWAALKTVDGVLVPGGFGDRGVQGKILAANFARTHKVPYFGICLGMQLAVVEYARNVMNMPTANSTEFDANTVAPVVVFMPEISKTHMGGTMRLGARTTILQTTDCLAAKLYHATGTRISERHRHRYEVNPELVKQLEDAGLRFVGRDETGTRMSVLELPLSAHPFFLGTQYHPEFRSRPGKPSPPFYGFILAASKQLSRFLQGEPLDPYPSPCPSPDKATLVTGAAMADLSLDRPPKSSPARALFPPAQPSGPVAMSQSLSPALAPIEHGPVTVASLSGNNQAPVDTGMPHAIPDGAHELAAGNP